MGYRTVVVLNNDSHWAGDPNLGKKIHHAAAEAVYAKKASFEHGSIAECQHADVQTIGVINSLEFSAIGHSGWRPGESDHEMKVRLLKDAAAELGYRVSKIPERVRRNT